MTDGLTIRHSGPDDAIVLSVIAPCFNEQDNIDLLVNRTLAVFNQLGIAAELVLVDDGSADDTWEKIEQRSQSDARIRGVKHASNQGIEGAWRSGHERVGGQLICLIDADLQNPPEDIPKLYRRYLRELPDIVQGVRHAVPGLRRYAIFSRGLNFLLNTVFRMHLRDNKSGFLLCRCDVLGCLLQHRYRYRYFQSFIGAAAGAQGYTIAEVDTTFDHRRAGRSFLSRLPIGVSTRIFWELLKFRVETWKPAVARARSKKADWPLAPAVHETATGQL